MKEGGIDLLGHPSVGKVSYLPSAAPPPPQSPPTFKDFLFSTRGQGGPSSGRPLAIDAFLEAFPQYSLLVVISRRDVRNEFSSPAMLVEVPSLFS